MSIRSTLSDKTRNQYVISKHKLANLQPESTKKYESQQYLYFQYQICVFLYVLKTNNRLCIMYMYIIIVRHFFKKKNK